MSSPRTETSRLPAGRRRDDDDFFVGEREHPITVGGYADEFRARAAVRELRHWGLGHLIGVFLDRHGAGNGLFLGFTLRFALFLWLRRSGDDFLLGCWGNFFFVSFRGRRGFGATNFGSNRAGRGGSDFGLLALRLFFANFNRPLLRPRGGRSLDRRLGVRSSDLRRRGFTGFNNRLRLVLRNFR